MERSSLNARTAQRQSGQAERKEARSTERDTAVAAALPALATARTTPGQLNAAAVQSLTALAGNGAVARLLRRGEARAERLPFPPYLPQAGQPYDARGPATGETGAAEGLTGLTPLWEAAAD